MPTDFCSLNPCALLRIQIDEISIHSGTQIKSYDWNLLLCSDVRNDLCIDVSKKHLNI